MELVKMFSLKIKTQRLRRAVLCSLFSVLCFPALAADCGVRGVQADAPVLCGRAIQGGLLFGESDWEIGGARAVQSGGLFVIGLPMDAAPDLRLAFEKNGVKKSFDYKIVPREYKEQRINVDDKFIKYPPEVERRIISESEKITAARSVIDTSFAEFMNLKYPFAKKWPTSGVYGSRRIFNGIPKAPHKGWDIAAPAGTPVLAVAAGRVALVIDSYMSGKTIIIDHGFSLYSVYAHLSKISIENGAVVRAGDAIGAVGRTGRASGAHLHLGLYFGNEAIDPELMVRD